jgi:inhibitor of KinA sporulation pathway (predicted exonuclease)
MLLVGACLQCHSDKEPRIADVFNDFSRYRTQLSPKCILPDWVE